MAEIYLAEAFTKCIKIICLALLTLFGILLTAPTFESYSTIYYLGGVTLLVFIISQTLHHWRSKEIISPAGKAILISGCDRGMGHLFAQRLDDLGFKVFAGCLFPNGEGAENLRKQGSTCMHVFGLDVTSDTSVQEALSYVEENLKEYKLWAVVNNAGIVDGCEIHWTDMETMKRIFDVNTFGVMRLTKSFLWRIKESTGRILVITSIGGRFMTPYIGPYCISKKASTGFCDGLRAEVCKWGIQVINIDPAFYRTALQKDFIRNARKAWEIAPKEVKKIYDSNYVDQITKNICFIWKYLSRDPTEVVHTLEHAVMTLHPACSYSVGDLTTRFFAWLYEMLPNSIVVIITQYVLKLIEFP